MMGIRPAHTKCINSSSLESAEDKSKPELVGWVLAGGKSTRMQGENKALCLYRNKTLLSYVVANLSPQVDIVVISAGTYNYDAFGLPTVPDSGQHGPLEGVLTGLNHLAQGQAEWLVTAPCDTPSLPSSWVRNVYQGLSNARCGYVQHNGKAHYAHAIWHRSCLERVADQFKRQRYSLRQALNACSANGIKLGVTDEDRLPYFSNINTPQHLSSQDV